MMPNDAIQLQSGVTPDDLKFKFRGSNFELWSTVIILLVRLSIKTILRSSILTFYDLLVFHELTYIIKSIVIAMDVL